MVFIYGLIKVVEFEYVVDDNVDEIPILLDFRFLLALWWFALKSYGSIGWMINSNDNVVCLYFLPNRIQLKNQYF